MFSAREIFSVPAGDAALLMRLEGGIRNVRFAQHNVGTIGEAMQGLGFRLGVGDVIEIFRRVFCRTVILVEAATPLENGSRFFDRFGWRLGYFRGVSLRSTGRAG